MRSASCALCLLVLPLTSSAHHGPGQYDLGQVIALQGVVTGVIWRDPHVRITVRTDDGALWTLEAGAASTLEESGVIRGTFEKGTRVQFVGSPARGGGNVLRATNAQLQTGRQVALEPGSQPPGADRALRQLASGAAREGWWDRGSSKLASSVALAIWLILCGTFVGGVLALRIARRSVGATP